MSESVDIREELQQTAEMLEQILEVMPDDLFTLRSLYGTYLKLEEPEKAFGALTRLDDQARGLQNGEMIAFVLEQYNSILDEKPEVQKRIDRLEELKLVTDLMEEQTAAPDPRPADRGVGIEAEMSLAWELFQDEQLSQEEYSNVLHDLSEMSSRSMEVPVTVLHVLHDRNFSRIDRLMTHLCQKSGVPIISLSQFDEHEDVRELLPLEFISRYGALPFSKIGGDVLVAVLNPTDSSLIEKAEELCGRRCHPCLVPPHEYDQRLGQIKKALSTA